MRQRCAFNFFYIMAAVIALTASGMNASAFQDEPGFHDLIQEAQYIMEGTVIESTRSAKRDIQTYVRNGDSFYARVGDAYTVKFKVNEVYKGKVKTNEEVLLYIPRWMEMTKKNLIVNGRYILFLKKHPTRPEYILVDPARASWRVFDYNGIRKVKALNELSVLRQSNDYLDSDDFHWILKEEIRKTASTPVVE